MNKIKGFTLIEILAVIIVLAVISLITIPLLLNVIKNAKIAAIKDSIYGISEAANLYYAKNIEDGISTNSIINLKDNTIRFKGSIDKGSLLFNDKGKTKIIISSGKYCAYKDYNEAVTVGNVDGNNCNINNTLIGLETLEIGESELRLMVHSEAEVPNEAGMNNEIVLISDKKVTNYLVSNTEPSIKNG